MLHRYRWPLLLTATVGFVFVLGVVAFAAPSRYESWAFPTVAAVLVWVIVALLRGRPRPETTMTVAFVTIGAMWVGLFAFHLYAPSSELPFGQRLVPGLVLGFVALTVVAHLALPTWQAFRASVAMFGTVAVIAFVWAVPAVVGGADRELAVRLTAHLAVYGAILVMLTVSARSKDALLASSSEAERLRAFAYVDPVTGLPNRRSVEERLERAFAIAERYRTPLSVAVVDLDRFKRVNDEHGHDVGDRVLHAFGEVVRGELRTGDEFGRWGGEEFVIVAPYTNAKAANELAERIRNRVQEHAFPAGVRITASFGVSALREGDSVRKLMGRADRRLYAAKESGRNRVTGAEVPCGDPAPPRQGTVEALAV